MAQIDDLTHDGFQYIIGLQYIISDLKAKIDERDEQLKVFRELLFEQSMELEACRDLIDSQKGSLATKDELIKVLSDSLELWKEEYNSLKIRNSFLSGKKKSRKKVSHTTMKIIKQNL